MIAFRGYEILETLPRGGMSTVYKARQVSLDRLVAIKVLPPAMGVDPEDIEKFMAEARITAGLRHQNIVQVYDFGKTEEGTCYFVMEYISGYTVSSWIQRKRYLSEENSLLCALSIATAMDYAWQKAGIVHCDIKPDNVIIDGDGTVKLADLGLARSVKSIVDHAPPAEKLVFGTPNYIAPEQSAGQEQLDCRADIYSLGAMLYHCLTGTMPFEGQEPMAVMDLQITSQIPDPGDINPQISIWSTCLIEKMMAKNRDYRQKSWGETIRDINNVRSEKMPQRILPPAVTSTVKRGAQRDMFMQEAGQALPAGPKKESRVSQIIEAIRKPGVKRTGLFRNILLAVSSAAFALTLLWMIYDSFKSPRSTFVTIQPITNISPPEAARPGTATQSTVTDAADEAAQKYKQVEDWFRANPRKYAEAMRRYKRLVNETMGTRFSESAQNEARRLEDIIARESAALMAQLDKKAEPLADQNHFLEAAAVYEKYQGAFEDETAADRRKKAQAARLKNVNFLKEQDRQKKLAQRQSVEAVGELALLIVEDGAGAALARLNGLVEENPPLYKRAEFQGIKSLLEKAAGAEQVIIESFRTQKNQTVTVAFVSGPTNVVIREIQNNLVIAEKVFVMEQGVIGVQKNFTMRDLALDEKISRLGSEDSAEHALMRMQMEIEAGNYQMAMISAGKTGAILALPLAAAVKKAGEHKAEQAIKTILSRADITSRDELPEPDFCMLSLSGKKFPPRKSMELKRGVSQFRAYFGFTDIASNYSVVLTALTNATARRATVSEAVPAAARPQEKKSQNGESAAALTSKIMEHNSGLREEEVAVRIGDSGQIETVEVVSLHLRDIRALENMRSLRRVVCAGMHQNVWIERPLIAPLDDLSPLRKMALYELIFNHTMVKDLSPLSQMSLTALNMAHTRVGDLQPLKDLKLQYLDISFTAVRDIRVLAGMPLKRLNISGTDVQDLGALSGAPLEFLYAGFTRIKNISVLANMQLVELSLCNTPLNDISCLDKMPLKFLNISGTRVRDISVLQNMLFKKLDLSRNDIGDISALSGMPLNYLDLHETAVKDLSALEGMPLEYLDISGTRIKNISALKGMPLKSLCLRGTEVTDLTPIQDSSIEEIWLDDLRWRENDEKTRAATAVLNKMPNLRSVNGRTR
jgi:serine/threonine-protein kinase